MKTKIYIFFILLLLTVNLFSNDKTDEDFLNFFLKDDAKKVTESVSNNLNINTVKFDFNLGDGVSEEWIRNLLTIQEDWKGHEDDLIKLLKYNEKKIIATNLFYNVNVAMMEPLDASSDKRVIIIDISSGFWYGFNFEPINFTIIFKNLSSRGQELGLTLGTTEQSIWYNEDYLFDLPLTLWAYIGNEIQKWEYPGIINNESLLNLQLGVKVLPWLNIKLDIGYQRNELLQEYLYFQADEYGISEPYNELFLGSKLETDWKSYKDNGITEVSWDLTSNYHFSRLNYFSTTSAMKIQMHIKDYIQVVFSQYSIYQTSQSNTFLKKRPMEFLYHRDRIKGVLYRGPLLKRLCDQALSFNLDLLLNNVLGFKGSVMGFDFQPLIFTDIAIFPDIYEYSAAIGGGINILVLPPVNMHFNVIFSKEIMNDEQNIGFYFVATDNLY